MRYLTVLMFLAVATLSLASPPYEAARQLYSERKDADAKSAFEALARSEPRNAEAAYYLGRLAMRAGEPETAVKHFKKAVDLDGKQAAYHLELGGAYGMKAQKAGLLSKMSLAGKARDALEKAVELEPNNLDARIGLMQYYSQAPGIVGGGMDKALAQAEEVARIDPARGRSAKAGLFAREKRYEEAFALYEDALKDSPDDYSMLYQVGRLAAESGQRLDWGLESLARCLAMTPPSGSPGHAAANWRTGNIWEKKGDKAAARGAYETSLAIDGKFESAIAALKKLN